MATSRVFGFSKVLILMAGLAAFLPGCGGGGGPGNTTGPNEEVKVVGPVDAQGNPVSLDENAPAKKAK